MPIEIEEFEAQIRRRRPAIWIRWYTDAYTVYGLRRVFEERSFSFALALFLSVSLPVIRGLFFLFFSPRSPSFGFCFGRETKGRILVYFFLLSCSELTLLGLKWFKEKYSEKRCINKFETIDVYLYTLGCFRRRRPRLPGLSIVLLAQVRPGPNYGRFESRDATRRV